MKKHEKKELNEEDLDEESDGNWYTYLLFPELENEYAKLFSRELTDTIN